METKLHRPRDWSEVNEDKVFPKTDDTNELQSLFDGELDIKRF